MEEIKQTLSVQVTGEGSSTPGHKWKSIDGSTIESKTTFPLSKHYLGK
jgi:hypothetical protein